MMTSIGLLQIAVYLFVLLIFVKPLGWYIAQVYEGKLSRYTMLERFIERPIYRLCGFKPHEGMDWKQYLFAMLAFNLLGLLAVYLLQRCQAYLPLNPQGFSAPEPILAWNIAVSFVTNTDWQSYGGETTLSYLTQMLALTTQNFLSAATGMSLFIALTRGISFSGGHHLGNFWVDTTRGTFYILLPLSLIMSVILVQQGVIQNLKPNQHIELLQVVNTKKAYQVVPMGPVASQVAIKQLGSNGGGFFNTNAAHPFENPTPLTNFLEMLALLLIPAALTHTFGIMIKDKRQGWAIFAVMMIIFIPLILGGVFSEQVGNPAFKSMGIDMTPVHHAYPGGNMEGKETRFGIVSSTLWSVATTASSNGSLNSMLDSYMPLGGLVPLWMMHLGETIFGGVGSGLFGMLMFVLLTVFVAGLMVGRTPEYLGKKIEPFEMKMASLAVLIMPLIVLISTAIVSLSKVGVSEVGNPGAHGFTEILYAFTSMTNNNGSAFAGLNANTMLYNGLGGIVMLIGRYWVAIPVLAIAGSLVQKKIIPTSSGTLATHTPLFIILLISIIIIIGALSFFPVLALGPIVEHFILWGHYVG